ncbi:MAG TPA: prenyltransferase/squalene oxidase repeat-containing protein [Pirellulales bacterium]|nr:prenyltransferase/squalene oxidase repeat-containing protein [Pirellulales bacterium]
MTSAITRFPQAQESPAVAPPASGSVPEQPASTLGRLVAAIERSPLLRPGTPGRRVWDYFLDNAPWWGTSLVAHMSLILIMGLVLGTVQVARTLSDAPTFETKVEEAPEVPDIGKFEVGEAPLDPTVLDTESLLMNEPPAVEEQINDDSPEFVEAGGGVSAANIMPGGGLGGFDFDASGDGPAVRGLGGVGGGEGTGNTGGSGGAGSGFGGRGSGMRKALAGRFGGTRQTERAVAAALNWIARHQNRDGSWSINAYNRQCKDRTCTGQGSAIADSAATAMGLLPFLAAGQTQKSKGPYKQTVNSGLYWLCQHQNSDGNLSGGVSIMYSHGLATITLCEAYGLTHDERIGQAAQLAVRFIERAQHPRTGGWRYVPGDEGDTSVVGWQVMALKSAEMAGLSVQPETLTGAKNFLKTCSSGNHGGLFGYVPGSGPTPTLTAVGLLCNQYMGVKRDDQLMTEGVDYLMQSPPNMNARNCYYWYYATQVMHNLPGPQWDTWNRQMRKILIESQVKEGCAAGSWNSAAPMRDNYDDVGGRMMITSLSCLILEVYYRYLPLYQLDEKGPDAKGVSLDQ